MAHRYLFLTRSCRNLFKSMLLPNNVRASDARLGVMAHPDSLVALNRGTMLASFLGAYRRLCSKPPKGFEKFFPNDKNGTKNSEPKPASSEAKGQLFPVTFLHGLAMYRQQPDEEGPKILTELVSRPDTMIKNRHGFV